MPKLIVALDDLEEEKALDLAKQIGRTAAWGFKTHDHHQIKALREHGHVMMDRKAIDIPSVVARFVKEYEALGADLVTITLAGGPTMIKEAVHAAKTIKVIGVGPLTSFTDDDAKAIYGEIREHTYTRLIRLGLENGVHGLVGAASDMYSMTYEISRHEKSYVIKIVTGVRPPGTQIKQDDQKVSPTWQTHDLQSANLVVVGRPITHADDPVKAAKNITDILTNLGT